MGRPLVLLVDDHADSRELTATILSGAGIAVAEAATGEQALRRAAMHPLPAAILLDLALPDMHGIALIQALRRTPEGRTLPIVVLSASVTPGDKAAVASAGCDSFLAKPILPDDLLVALMRALGPAGR